MRDAETFVISRLMWFRTPQSTRAHNGPRQRYATDIEPVAAAAQILQQLGPRAFGKRGAVRRDKQIEPIRIQARD